ncbi:hypothetical protein ACH41H_45775 [Streptomyces sp. NPDC020800]|uniref:hypothetical protein n=1 Tax=Streptomyces sp. NPDC020800 TaxID=3365092 RepID=UPI0037AB52C8
MGSGRKAGRQPSHRQQAPPKRSQTGRDLWTRTVPQRGQYSEGFPVLPEELRGLLHTTARLVRGC